MPLIIPGQSRPNDLNITTHHGKVVIQLSRPTSEIALTVEEAVKISRALAQQVLTLIGLAIGELQ